jgi:hypothetical protein
MRQKIFGMIAVPLDRNEKARLLHRARAMMRATEKGRHYGAVSAKAYAVFAAILMQFHNCKSGRAFPSYNRLQEAVGCCRQTVAASIAALEAAGLLGVCNRLVRVRWRDELALVTRTRVMRTSNCYTFPSAATARSSESKLQAGTGIQVLPDLLSGALDRLQGAFRGRKAQDSDRRWAIGNSPLSAPCRQG